MAQLKDNLLYVLARTGVAAARMMSRKTAYNFGGWLGRVMHRLLKSRRVVAYDNLSKAFPGKYSDDELNLIIKKVFENIGRTFIEFTRFDKLGYAGIKEIVTPDGEEYLKKAHDEGKGAIILTAHFGSWEMLGGYLTQYGYEVDAMVGIQHNKKIDTMVNNFRADFNIKIIRVGGTNLRQVFKALKANHFIVNLPDQHDPSASLILDFFGRKTTVARGPALFALRANCPILPLLLKRNDYNSYQVISGKPIYPEKTSDEEEDVKRITLQYMKFLEDNISQNPEQWMWTHRRWKI